CSSVICREDFASFTNELSCSTASTSGSVTGDSEAADGFDGTAVFVVALEGEDGGLFVGWFVGGFCTHAASISSTANSNRRPKYGNKYLCFPPGAKRNDSLHMTLNG